MTCKLETAGRCSCPDCKARKEAHNQRLVNENGYVWIHVPAEGLRAARTILLPPAMADGYVAAGAGYVVA